MRRWPRGPLRSSSAAVGLPAGGRAGAGDVARLVDDVRATGATTVFARRRLARLADTVARRPRGHGGTDRSGLTSAEVEAARLLPSCARTWALRGRWDADGAAPRRSTSRLSRSSPRHPRALEDVSLTVERGLLDRRPERRREDDALRPAGPEAQPGSVPGARPDTRHRGSATSRSGRACVATPVGPRGRRSRRSLCAGPGRCARTTARLSPVPSSGSVSPTGPTRRLDASRRDAAARLIARALAAGPALLALDEPTTGVDAESQESLAVLLAEPA